MNNIFQKVMRNATRLTRDGRLSEATREILRALNPQGSAPPPVGSTTQSGSANASPAGALRPIKPIRPTPVTLDAMPTVPGGNQFEVDMRNSEAEQTDSVEPAQSQAPDLHAAAPFSTAADFTDVDFDANGATREGEFVGGTHTYLLKTLRYKLYSPPVNDIRPRPLIVMLHGCTQSPDDFAAGTGMNTIARAQGFYVLYPEQSQRANSSRCWNWFQPNDQTRDRGEPAFIASMTQAVMSQHNIDPLRVYIAGLSAGGAMAAIVAEAFPEIFAAVGVHSGLRRGAASSVIDALTVMRTGNVAPTRAALRMHASVPTIVFHGDNDQTVHPRHGEHVVTAVLTSDNAKQWNMKPASNPQIESGTSTKGRRYTRTSHHDATGRPMLEHWLVHGAGHAWSGGSENGSYTDAKGPNASDEMIRFFMSNPLA